MIKKGDKFKSKRLKGMEVEVLDVEGNMIIYKYKDSAHIYKVSEEGFLKTYKRKGEL